MYNILVLLQPLESKVQVVSTSLNLKSATIYSQFIFTEPKIMSKPMAQTFLLIHGWRACSLLEMFEYLRKLID